jgi:hypothetical protein
VLASRLGGFMRATTHNPKEEQVLKKSIQVININSNNRDEMQLIKNF